MLHMLFPVFFIGKREEEGFFFKVEDRDFYPAIHLNMLMYIHKSFLYQAFHNNFNEIKMPKVTQEPFK